jgi:Zinc-binding dehydrogenase/Alcohol dehydrogenase GroES-like domain
MVALGKKPCADGRIPLSDGAGEVITVGDGVDEFKVGDAVVSTYWPDWLGGESTAANKRGELGDDVDGYAREYVCMPSHAFTRAPAGYSHAEAATLTCAGITAWRSLMVCGQVKPGATVLILGTGSVSLFALQFAKMAGARVIATSASEEKLEKLRRLGADAVINYKAVPDWGRKAKDLTDGRGCRFRRCFQSDSYQWDLHWQPRRSGGDDSGDHSQSVEARNRPLLCAGGNRCCLRALRISKALWQGLPPVGGRSTQPRGDLSGTTVGAPQAQLLDDPRAQP